jgi:type IV/VI secretion system ImpK/VasF family protein
MTNDFGQRVYPVIRYVSDLLSDIRGGRTPADPQSVATELRTLLAQFDVQGERRKEYYLARSALVYWIDEVLVNSDWEYAGYWNNHTLERSYFDARERAWRFFEKAEAARSLENLDALETFYLCACFGFKGIYRDDQRQPRKEKPEQTGDTWDPDNAPDAPPVAPSDEADEDGAGRKTRAKKKSDWWDSDEGEENAGMMTWGIGGDEMSESMIGDIAGDASVLKAPLPKRTRQNQAATFQEWLDSVYRQLAPMVQPPFAPANPPSELGTAKPLAGRPAFVTASTLLILGFGLCVVLVILGLVRTAA